MPIRPVIDYILVKKIEPETRTASGLIIPTADKDEPVRAVIIEMGNSDSQLAIDDIVILTKYAGVPVTDDGIKYLLIKLEDVMAWEQR